jgi:hypothetical protein
MADPRHLSSEAFEIVAPREIRKAGLDVMDLRVHRRVRLVDEEGEAVGFTLELSAQLVVGGDMRPALIVCRSEPEAIDAEIIDAVRESARRAEAQHALLFSASGYDTKAIARGRELGMALLVIVDGRAAFARRAWGAGGPAPSWVPEHMAEVVSTDAAGLPVQEPITPDRAELLLDRLRD